MSEKHKTFIGTIMEVPCGINSEYFFELENGDFLNLENNESVQKIPINTKVAVCMSTKEFNGFRRVCSHVPFFTEIE